MCDVMMEPEVLVTRLEAIVADGSPSALAAHGISRVDCVVPAGHYRRRQAVYTDLTHLLPWENIYRLFLDNRYQAYGALSRYVLRDAVVTDQGCVVTAGDALVEESCWEFLAHQHVPFGLQRVEQDRFRFTEPPSRTIEAPTLLVKRPWWRNYGHFLVDAAALLALLRQRGVGGFAQIVVGKAEDPKLRAVMREVLDLVAPSLPVLEQDDRSMWRFTELHYMQPVRRPPMFTLPEAVEALRTAVLGASPGPEGGRRLFLPRRAHARHRLENEEEIETLLAGYGFEAVYPEQMTVAEQAALFRSASVIAGAKGAAMANQIFAPADATLIALSPADFSDPFFLDIGTARGMAYAELFGSLVTSDQPPALNPFTIEPARLEALLRAVLPEPVSSPAAPAAPAAEPGFPSPLRGANYLACLDRLHAVLRPRSYLEIGTLNGTTLALSRCRSVAVDPRFQLSVKVPGRMPSLFLYQGPSDAFFAEVDVAAVLGGAVELAFLDGLHLFEVLLRDFINTERLCRPNSVILLHDCVPLDAAMAEREGEAALAGRNARYPGWWTGDVWKTVDALLRWRPDLDIVALDAPPTGLVMVRNLDPGSRVLEREYPTILETYRGRAAPADFAAYFARLPMRSTAFIDGLAAIAAPAQAASIASA